MAGKGRNKFAEAARAAWKGIVVAGTSTPPPKRAQWAEEIITLPPPSPPPSTTNELSVIRPESSSRATPLIPTIQLHTQNKKAGTGISWPWGIQHLAIALIQDDSLLKEPRLSVLIANNPLKLGDCHRLGIVETDELYNNIIHSAIESAMCAYLAKEHNKALRREFCA